MTQIKTFRNEDLSRLEDEVNRWLQSQNDKITVIGTSNNVQPSGISDSIKKTTYITVVTYEEKPKILHG